MAGADIASMPTVAEWPLKGQAEQGGAYKFSEQEIQPPPPDPPQPAVSAPPAPEQPEPHPVAVDAANFAVSAVNVALALKGASRMQKTVYGTLREDDPAWTTGRQITVTVEWEL